VVNRVAKQEQAHDETCFGGCFFVSEMTSMSMLPAIGLQPTRRVKTGHFSGNLFMAHAQRCPLSQVIGPAGPLPASYSTSSANIRVWPFSISVAVVFGWSTDALPLCAYAKGNLQSIQCKQNKDGVLNHVIADCDP